MQAQVEARGGAWQSMQFSQLLWTDTLPFAFSSAPRLRTCERNGTLSRLACFPACGHSACSMDAASMQSTCDGASTSKPASTNAD